MYCAACNLNYSDRLNFCRRCGQSLVYSSSDPVMDTVCCTRCGARTIKGEKACRQCGSSGVSSAPEVVVGACYHCGASWRSGWLFCRTCGMDRERALLLPTSRPASIPSSTVTGAPPSREAASEVEELQEVAKVSCKRCGAMAKPFSRYCETCGNTLSLSKGVPPKEPAESEQDQGVITGKLPVPPVAAAFRTQADLPAGGLQASLSNRGRSLEPFKEPGRAGRKTVGVNNSPTNGVHGATGSLSNRPTNPNSETKMKSFEGPIPNGRTEQLVERSDSRGAILVWIIIAALGVGAGLVAWRLWTNQKKLSKSPRSATEQSSLQSPIGLVGASPQPSQSLKDITAPQGMVFVPGGMFKMGRDDGDELERPAHIVEVKPFFIDRNEVTNEEYQRFVSATNRRAPAHWVGGKIPGGQLKFPVVNVSWSDANAYAKWAKKRLPTEAEWEFAARGTDGRVYPWGNEWKPDHANAGQGKNGKLLDTGRYGAGVSPFGALDMCGNAWEWTASDFRDYPGRQTASSLTGSGLKVIRGGAYDADLKNATMTYRGAVSPDRAYDKTGFRCARDVR